MADLIAQKLMCIKRDRVLFEALDFSLGAKQIVHLKGPNGAGKTSFLRILAGLATATEGVVKYKEKNIESAGHDFYTSTLYIGHKSGLNSALTGIENTQFWANQHGIDISQSEIIALLGMIGLAGLEDLPVAHLSAGQQRRVSLLRLWLKSQARIWLLDEPFTALDVQGVALIEKKIQEHAESGGSVLITSHQALQPHPLKSEFMLEYRF
ncbi:cytochrome c biogenesis heme-transporting ATPase CcmA [Alteromonas sediminis]|uniref:Cytochrome c biogenesis heme-transporting ATPase CcmA n=1 Tax=Alteromonas sediminis TaxID=2259342 RepID=A0A3N5ZAU0_9ALTE|nr:cytochrome c biogenesis heme-transporting ATPase CcmA [Alteromonas sediminis]RPJ68274.1 cytochrome c biogenesis heme-transporting ATPase CcmA [Alteromonas sediminis]